MFFCCVCALQGKGKGKGKGKALPKAENEEDKERRGVSGEGDEKSSTFSEDELPIAKLKTLDVFAGCGGLWRWHKNNSTHLSSNSFVMTLI